MIINELGGSPTRPDNVYFTKNEQASLALFIAHAKHNLIKLKLYNNWSAQTVNSILDCAIPADTDVFQTSSGHLKRVTTSYDQKKTSSRRLEKDVGFTSSWRRPIYDVLKTSVLRLLQDVWFAMSWRCLIYVVLKTSNLRRLENAWFTMSSGRLIYDVLKTSVKRHLCSNVVATFIQHRKKWLLLILYCLKYSENFKCSS